MSGKVSVCIAGSSTRLTGKGPSGDPLMNQPKLVIMIIIVEDATYRGLSEGSDLNKMVEVIKGGPRIYLEGLGGSWEPVTRLEQHREWTPRAQNTNGSFTGAQKPYKHMTLPVSYHLCVPSRVT